MFTSIPYDQGWTVRVDGKTTAYRIYSNTFITFDIPSGKHTVEFSYRPRGFGIGIAVSVLSILVFLAFTILSVRKKLFPERSSEK